MVSKEPPKLLGVGSIPTRPANFMPKVPILCSIGNCPYKAFTFRYISEIIFDKRCSERTFIKVLGFCILHEKENCDKFAGIRYDSRKEIEGLFLAKKIIDE